MSLATSHTTPGFEREQEFFHSDCWIREFTINNPHPFDRHSEHVRTYTVTYVPKHGAVFPKEQKMMRTPQKPKEPEKTYQNPAVYLNRGETMDIPDGAESMKYIDTYHHQAARVVFEGNNKNYDQEMEAYNLKLKEYERELKEFEREILRGKIKDMDDQVRVAHDCAVRKQDQLDKMQAELRKAELRKLDCDCDC